jgi:glyoxylase I family protein
MSVKPPFDLRAIDHVVLIVDDLDAAVKWYADVLGATEEGDLRQFGMVQLRTGASMIDLVDAASKEGKWARPKVEGGRNMDHLCLEIEEEGLRSGAKGRGYSWYIRDPWDHQIELKTDKG